MQYFHSENINKEYNQKVHSQLWEELKFWDILRDSGSIYFGMPMMLLKFL